MSGSERHRRLVDESLSPLLNEVERARAMEAWAAAFGGKPALIPSMVAAHLAKTLDLGDLEETIRTRLTQALLEDHGATRARTENGEAKSASSERSNRSRATPAGADATRAMDAAVVLRAMLRGVTERLRAMLGADAKGMEAEWCDAFKRKKLAGTARQTIERWCRASGNGTDSPIGGDISTDDMRTVVHTIYVWCCEALGPVETDRVFADTVEATSGLPEARRFAPSELL